MLWPNFDGRKRFPLKRKKVPRNLTKAPDYFLNSMKLYNTLSNKIEEFKPLADPVLMYTCGPTVYNTAHIGNLRTYVFEDILRRTLKYNRLSLIQAMNITDIDDKTIKNSDGNLNKFKELTRRYEADFFTDLRKLNIEKPEKVTRATDYIDKIVQFIEDLIKKGFAYKSDDGSVYFSIAKFGDYGKLSGLDKSGLKSGARVSQDEYDKENPADFALWKAYDESDGEIFYDSPWGRGRPGWHIECSVMVGDALGETIDIHAGAVDLVFPHHENEIAQSEAKNGKPFARFWVHGEHLLVDGRKMSKSLNNFYTLSDIEKKDYSPLDFRYFCLLGHYRSKLNFTWEGLDAARNALSNVRSHLERLADLKPVDNKIIEKAKTDFAKAVDDDLNTPQAIGVLQDLISSCQESNAGGQPLMDLIKDFDQVLALGLINNVDIPDQVLKLAEARARAKKAGNFSEADAIRDQILKLGFSVEDTQKSYKILPK